MELERLMPPLMPAHIAALVAVGVTSVQDLSKLRPHHLMQVAGITLLEAHVILRAGYAVICPLPSTVGKLLRRERELRPFIPTPLAALTTALHGGLAPSVTEVVGPAGAVGM